MIPVQHGRGGWVNSRSTLAKAMTMAIAGVVVMLVMASCSSKKPAAVDANNPNGNGLGENTSNGSGSDLDKWEQGTVGRGGPLSDIHFGYNDSTINDQDGSVLKSNASWLQAHPQTKVQVEGYCDERGSEEYNIALGAKRAQAGKDYLADARNQRQQNVDNQLRQGASTLPRTTTKAAGSRTGAITFRSAKYSEQQGLDACEKPTG